MPKKLTMRFHMLTLFPKILDSYFNESILKRAQQKKLITIKAHNFRDYTTDKHHTTDDAPYGGGAGMVMKADPILKAVSKIISTGKKRKTKRKIIILSAKGKQFTQKIAYDWSRKYSELILISGRYEGIDERVKTILKANEISIGHYVLTDGDVAAMVVISAISRLVPGVIKLESLKEESHWNLLLKKEKSSLAEALEYPHYTRPEIFAYKGKKYRAPKVLLSGNHKKINEWRKEKMKSY